MPKIKRVVSSQELTKLYANGYSSAELARIYGKSSIWFRKLKQKLKANEVW